MAGRAFRGSEELGRSRFRENKTARARKGCGQGRVVTQVRHVTRPQEVTLEGSGRFPM